MIVKTEKQIAAWITKYALTKGIQKKTAVQVSQDMIQLPNENGYPYYHGKEWHESEEEARHEAERMRLSKIESLEKSLRKLRSLRFE